jgi:hypothetical protein
MSLIATNLVAANFDPANQKGSSSLTSDALIGATTLSVATVAEIDINDPLFFGSPTNQNMERVFVQSITGLVVTLTTALIYEHNIYEQIFVAYGDSIDFYRIPNTGAGVPDPTVTTPTSIQIVEIDPISYNTEYTDTSGGSAFYYGYTYQNSLTTDETPITDATWVIGGQVGHFTTIDRIRNEAGLMNVPAVTDQVLDEMRSAAEDYINDRLHNSYDIPLPTPYPPILGRIATLIAAGWTLQQQQYGQFSPKQDEGDSKATEGEVKLQMIVDREMTLLDQFGHSLLLDEDLGVNSWPNSTTSTGIPGDPSIGGNNGDNGPMFYRGKIF